MKAERKERGPGGGPKVCGIKRQYRDNNTVFGEKSQERQCEDINIDDLLIGGNNSWKDQRKEVRSQTQTNPMKNQS